MRMLRCAVGCPLSAALIRPATLADATAIARIYNPYIRDTIITFEEVEVRADEIASRMRSVAGVSLPWLVLEEVSEVIGYSYASPWHARSAYRHTVEATIYLEASACGRGHGRRLYSTLLDELRRLPVHAVVGGIALPNDASVALHKKLGFKQVAHYPVEIIRQFTPEDRLPEVARALRMLTPNAAPVVDAAE